MAAEAASARLPLSFALTPTSRLVLHKGSIVGFRGDVIVSPTNEMLYCDWYGASGAILLAGGDALMDACAKLPPWDYGAAGPAAARQVKCPTGCAVLTSAGQLSARHVVHAVGPIYTVPADSAPLLDSAYRFALSLANEHKAASIAFPAISCGLFGYPPGEAAEIALRACQAKAGRLQSIHFYLMGEAEAAAWLEHATALFQPLPQAPMLQGSPGLRQLMQAAQVGREDEVLKLLPSLVASLAGGSAGAAASGGPHAHEAAGRHAQHVGGGSGDGSPGSAELRDRLARSSLPDAHGKQQERAHSGSGSGAVGSAGGFAAVDVRRWMFEYSRFRRLRRLGAGSFGEVWLADYKGTSFAVKQLFLGGRDRGEAGPPPPLSPAQLREFQREAELVADVHHPHVLAFMGICSEPPCLVTEYCAMGSLYDTLREAARQAADSPSEGGPKFKQLTWVRRLSLLWGTAKGVAALHSHSPPIIHRDLRSPNIFISYPWVAKVGDFNLSRFADDSAAARTQPSVAPTRNPRWLAPEALHSITKHQLHPATPACDAYAFGQVMYEMLTWTVPWADCHDYAVLMKLTCGERPPVPPPKQLPGVDTDQFKGLDAYLELMHGCWEEDPARRPGFESIAQRLHSQLQLHMEAQRRAADGGQEGG